MKRALTLTTVLAGAALALSAWAWPHLPDPMPIHWGPDGRPDGWASRAFGAWFAPALALGLPWVLAGLLRLDPRRAHVERSELAVTTVLVGTNVVLVGVHAVALRAAMTPGHPLEAGWVMALVGGLFIALGNVLPKAKSNFFLGVRTPWTLDDEAVWHRTHRVAGWCFAAAGAVGLIGGVLLDPAVSTWAFVGSAIAAGVVPTAYSWWIHTPDGGASVG